MRKNKKWKMYLYYKGIHIKTLKIDKNEEPNKNSYVINVWFKKQLFASNKVGIIARPFKIVKNDERHRKTYWEIILEEGLEI